jgi:hypothetical protein
MSPRLRRALGTVGWFVLAVVAGFAAGALVVWLLGASA